MTVLVADTKFGRLSRASCEQRKNSLHAGVTGDDDAERDHCDVNGLFRERRCPTLEVQHRWVDEAQRHTEGQSQ